MSLMDKYLAAVSDACTETLRLSQLVLKAAYQIRDGDLDAEHVKTIADSYRAGEPVDRPRVFRVNGVCLLTRGYHRKEAAKLAGLTELECEVIDCADLRLAEIDALQGNNHRAKSMSREEKKKAVCRLYDLEVIPRDSAGTVFGRLVGLSGQTVDKYLDEHDPARGEQAVRVGLDGRGRKTPSAQKDKKAGKTDAPPPALLDTPEPADTPVRETKAKVEPKAERKGVDSGYDGPLVGYGYCLPDERWMPHVDEAEELSAFLLAAKAKLEAVRRELREKFDGRYEVVAGRIGWSSAQVKKGQFQADLDALVNTLTENVPDHLCPACVGTGRDESGEVCRHCDGFGFLDSTSASGLAGLWKKSERRYERMAKAAALNSAEASL